MASKPSNGRRAPSESNGRRPRGEDSSESKGEWGTQRGLYRSVGRRGAAGTQKAVRFALGAGKPTNSEPPTRWSDYLIVFAGWAAILALCAALAYVLYHGLELFGFIGP